MQFTILPIIIMAIIALILGMLWYGPLMFGKIWMKINGVMDRHGTMLISEGEMKQKQREAGPLYAIQFILSVVTLIALEYLIKSSTGMGGISIALLVWIGFIVPVQAGEAMWNSLSNDYKFKKFLVGAGYQLILMIIAGYVLSVF